MRKTLGVSLTAMTLLFGGAGVAQAITPVVPMRHPPRRHWPPIQTKATATTRACGVLQAC
jgi:hypothetical protein